MRIANAIRRGNGTTGAVAATSSRNSAIGSAVIDPGAGQHLARQQQIGGEEDRQRDPEARRDREPAAPRQRREQPDKQRETGDVERPAVIVEDAEQQVGLAPESA